MSNRGKNVLVAGGGGFIGGFLVKAVLDDGASHVRVIDVKPQSKWFQVHKNVENIVGDLSMLDECVRAVKEIDIIYNLAADMGGMGFIENNKTLCMLSVLINTHLLMAARNGKMVERYFYSSSACVYNADKQSDPNSTALKEEDAYPAMPEDGYGWEKLFSERMCRHFMDDFGIKTRVARLHNVYGPFGTYDGGREKAPAAICRKVISAKLTGCHEIEIWGDGRQTRSFQYIDDCIKGINLITFNDKVEFPINLGSSELVTINQLVDLVEGFAGISLKRHYRLDAPQGVRGRNSDNELIRKHLEWSPSTPLKYGLKQTYDWIEAQMTMQKKGR